MGARRWPRRVPVLQREVPQVFGLGPGSQVSENKGSAGPFTRLVRGKEGDPSAD